MSSSPRVRIWWTEKEDQILRHEAERQLTQGSVRNWNQIAPKLPGRTNKDCRKRWSKVRENVKKGAWSSAEDERLQSAVERFGYRWTIVAESVGTRHADQCAKRWHHSLNPTLDHSEWSPEDDERLLAVVDVYGRNWTTVRETTFPFRSDRTGLEAIWSSRWSTPFTGFGSIDLIGGVAWIKPGGAPGAPQLIPLREED